MKTRLVRASRRANAMTAAAHERDCKGKKRATTANDSDDEDESGEEDWVYSFRKRTGAGREEGKSMLVVIADKRMRLCNLAIGLRFWDGGRFWLAGGTPPFSPSIVLVPSTDLCRSIGVSGISVSMARPGQVVLDRTSASPHRIEVEGRLPNE